uniref:EF-hand domain-containing protein n=1 Tax=Heterorhabditis bacteriophora TaxID=37862 RepID=A0A1I7X9K3_HETBA
MEFIKRRPFGGTNRKDEKASRASAVNNNPPHRLLIDPTFLRTDPLRSPLFCYKYDLVIVSVFMSEIEVERFFSICDRGGKGYLVKEDLKVICPQLDDNDIVFIFAQLDSDGSGRIEKEAFCTKFENTVMQGEKNGLDGMQRRASVIEPTNVSFSNNVSTVSRTIIENSPFQQEDEVFDSDVGHVFPLPSLTHYETDKLYDSESDTSVSVDFAFPCQEEVLLLYQQLQSAGIPQLLKKFERVVGAFYKEIKEQKTENERLQHVYESERNMHHRIMEDVENELDQHLKVVEKKAREEAFSSNTSIVQPMFICFNFIKERIKLIREKEEMRTQLAAEMRDMQENIEKLQRIETVLQQKELKNNHQRELQEKLQVTEAFVDEISAAVEDNQNMQKQVQLLFEANKKLHDTNDSLREALDSRATLLRQFNLRTPSPLIFRDGMDSACTASCITSESVKLFSTTSACKFALEDDIVSFDGNSSHNSDQPKDNIAPSIVSL